MEENNMSYYLVEVETTNGTAKMPIAKLPSACLQETIRTNVEQFDEIVKVVETKLITKKEFDHLNFLAAT